MGSALQFLHIFSICICQSQIYWKECVFVFSLLFRPRNATILIYLPSINANRDIQKETLRNWDIDLYTCRWNWMPSFRCKLWIWTCQISSSSYKTVLNFIWCLKFLNHISLLHCKYQILLKTHEHKFSFPQIFVYLLFEVVEIILCLRYCCSIRKTFHWLV